MILGGDSWFRFIVIVSSCSSIASVNFEWHTSWVADDGNIMVSVRKLFVKAKHSNKKNKKVVLLCVAQTERVSCKLLWIVPLRRSIPEAITPYTELTTVTLTTQDKWSEALVYWQSLSFNTPQLLSPLLNSLTQQHLLKGLLFYYPALGWPMNLRDLGADEAGGT